MDELQKSLDKGLAGYTQRNSELKTELDKQNTIAGDTSKSFAERETAAKKGLITLREQNTLMLQRLKDEEELLRLKLSQNGLTSAENAELAEMAAKRKDAADNAAKTEKDAAGKIKAIQNEAYTHKAELNRKAMDNAITKQKQELDLFVAQGAAQAKTQSEQIVFEQTASDKRLALLKKELDAKKISQTEYDTAVINETNTLAQKVSGINIEHGRAALNFAVQQSRSVLDDKKQLTQQLIAEENARLENLHKMKMEQLALEKSIDAKTIEQKQQTNQQLSIYEQEFVTQKLADDAELKSQLDANNNKFIAYQKEKEAQQKAIDAEVALAGAATEYEQGIINEDIRHAEAMARLDQMLSDKKITQEQYEIMERAEAQKTAQIKTQLALQAAQSQLGNMQNVANAIGDAFGQSKELAIAQASISGAQAILSIWSGQISGNPLIDTAIKAVLTATTAISTAKQIQSIKQQKKPKTPKFASGGLQMVGGQRHSQGGTRFQGEDGTAFEAEQGELIGVMNRSAARHFMAFNNAFPAGGTSAPNYFAGGGIVSREIAPQGLNTDELAAKIVEANRSLPAPVVAVQDIITQGNSYVQVRDSANF